MREFKFRAWDKNKKKWLLGYDYSSLGGFSMFGETIMMGEYSSLLSTYFPDKIKDIELMQYTGLKDKNEKQVYEGDILNWKGNMLEVRWGGVGWVLYGKIFSSFGSPRGGDCGESNTKGYLAQSEVAGNVYQNPDLLLQGKDYYDSQVV